MHLILLDKKLNVFQGMKATYHLKATYHITQLICLTLLKNESKMNPSFNKLFILNMDLLIYIKNNLSISQTFSASLVCRE